MALPSFFNFIDPLLRHLAQHPEGVRVRDAYNAVADAVQLTDDQKAQLLPSGRQAVFKNRIGWAHDRLKRDGLSGSPSRGVWRITENGIALAGKHPNGLPDDELRRLAHPERDSKVSDDEDVTGTATSLDAAESQSPEERIEEAVDELNRAAADDLLELILQASPAFFEKLVLDLLHAMGYGTSRVDLQRVGGSGDGGIDGIISLDRLGLEKVYVQAKRWQNKVGRPEIQGFFGALAGRRATKGVFITTSGFSKEAHEYAEQVSDHLVLLNGRKLTELMIEHGVGVTHKSVKLPQIDSDYFDEG